MADEAPYTSFRSHIAPAVATAGNDANTPVFIAPYACTVSSVQYVTATAITGADTNSRTVSLINKGAAGSGTTSVASLALVSGVNTVAYVPKAITVSATAANLVLTAGDVLNWNSLHVGNGIADTGGLVVVSYSRNDG